jgi:hypothetical protein
LELKRRHCEERSDEAIQSFFALQYGLLRFARNDDLLCIACTTADVANPTMDNAARKIENGIGMETSALRNKQGGLNA